MDLNSNFYEIKEPMLKILVTYAVQGEFVELKWPDIEPYYVRTGIGKVKSAFHLAEAIRQVQPDLVLNIGSAGTVNHQVGDIFVCRKFVDRDMQKMAEFGLECEINSSALLEEKDIARIGRKMESAIQEMASSPS